MGGKRESTHGVKVHHRYRNTINNIFLLSLFLRFFHTVRFFSDCDCDSSYRNKWVVQDSREVFTLCDCDNISKSLCSPIASKKQIAVAIRKSRTV